MDKYTEEQIKEFIESFINKELEYMKSRHTTSLVRQEIFDKVQCLSILRENVWKIDTILNNEA